MLPAFVAAVRRRRLIAVVLATMLVTMPITALAFHRFVDVPNSNPFHDDITLMAEAGITLGCGDGKYCPSDFVTREQMAAFLNRGYPRAALASGSVSFADTGSLYVAELSMVTGGAAGGSGFVVVDADVSASTNTPGRCPCDVTVWVDMLDGSRTFLGSSDGMYFDVLDTATPLGYRSEAGSVSWVFQVPTASTRIFSVGAFVSTTNPPAPGGDEFVAAILTATYVPFGEATP